jgi:hypothetical protein
LEEIFPHIPAAVSNDAAHSLGILSAALIAKCRPQNLCKNLFGPSAKIINRRLEMGRNGSFLQKCANLSRNRDTRRPIAKSYGAQRRPERKPQEAAA